MRAMRIVSVALIGIAFFLVVTARPVRAECCYFNPFLLPFAVAGAAIGTAAAITTGVVGAPGYVYPAYSPGYYGPAYYGPAYYGPAPVYYGQRSHYYRHTWGHGHHDRYRGRDHGHGRRY